MFPNGLVILTQPVSSLRTQIPRLLEHLTSVVSDTVYIHLQPALHCASSLHTSLLAPLACTTDVQSFISDMYGLSSSSCQNLDIRVLLAHITNKAHAGPPNYKYKLKKALNVLISDAPFLVEAWNTDRLSTVGLLQQSFSERIHSGLVVEALIQRFNSGSSCTTEVKSEATRLTTYDHVVLGGTFDRLHSGHRLLLSQSCLLCEKELCVGVTSAAMNGKKILRELILPQSEREAEVREFVNDIKPSIDSDIICINDVYGPTVHKPEFQCLVVSQETVRGGTMINEERKKNGMQALDLVTLDLVEDACHGPEEEEKVSSSSQRRRLLGALLNPVLHKSHLPKQPYRIGLTGGIASGKSNMCQQLKKLGATIINCDNLGHKAYEPGTKGFTAVVSEFGEQLVTESGHIDRQKLGSIVFSDKNNDERGSAAIVPDSWLVPGRNQCRWPKTKFGTSGLIRQKKEPGPAWGIHPYVRIKHSSASLEHMEMLLDQFMEKSDLDTDLDTLPNSEAGNVHKRKRVATKPWSPQRENYPSPAIPDIQRRDSNSQPLEEPETNRMPTTSQHRSQSPIQRLPAPPPRFQSRDRTQIGQRSSSITETTDYLPFMEMLIKGQEEIKAEIRQLRIELNQHRQERQLVMEDGREILTKPALPETFDFPLRQQEDLERLNEALSSETVRTRMVCYLANIGGADSRKAAYAVFERVMKASLSIKYNLSGKHQKLEFNQLQNLKCTLYTSIRKRFPEASDKILDGHVSKWFSGSVDRMPGGRNERQNNKRKSNLVEAEEIEEIIE